MTDHGDQDMSWVESGYISHPATVNPFPIDGEDFNTHDQSLYDSSAVYEGDDTIRDEPTSLECISVDIREQQYSVTSSTSTIAILLGGINDCIQPVRTALTSVKGLFNHCKIDHRHLRVDEKRDFHSQGMEGTVLKTMYRGHQVAVKRLLQQKMFNPGLIEKLIRLKPENIVTFKGYTVDPHQYVMEFLPHGTLSSYISRGGEISPQLLIRWSRNIVNGLEHIHDLNLIHCDLKSANLMFDSKGEEIKIIDLESSATIPEGLDQVSMNRARGTTPYMSPEMIKQLPCTTMVDIWGFGIVLWEMVTLTPPYKGKEEQYVFYGIGMNKISLPIPDDIPDGIKLLLQMCWKQAPEARPCAFYIKKHLEELEKELQLTSNESYRQSQMSWRQDCDYVEYEFDIDEIKQWSRDLECYRQLQMRYAALMTSYNNLYQEFKTMRKGQEPTTSRFRKRSSRKKKKSPSKASLLFSNQNSVPLCRTVSAPIISNKNTLDRLTDRICQTPKANTLGAEYKVQNLPMDRFPGTSDRMCSPFSRYQEYVSPIESDSSHSSRGSVAAHADVESGGETSEIDRIALPVQRHFAKYSTQMLVTKEENDSAFDLSLSSQPELQCPEMESPDISNEHVTDRVTDPMVVNGMTDQVIEINMTSDDEFGDENLENYGITC